MELKTHRAGTMVDLAWNEPNCAAPDIDHHVERRRAMVGPRPNIDSAIELR